jgi:ferritin-like metal-binding protein YciE
MKQMLMTLMALLMVGAGCKTGKVDSSRVEPLRQRQISDEELQAISDLHVAAEEGDLAKVKQCLKAGTDIDCVAGKASSRILHKAARAGDKAMAAFLIQQKANINAWAIYGTPLDLAIKEGHADVAQLLRKHGAKTGEELEAKEK